MSGIEVAGLVLGAFPIVVEGVEFYLKGVKTVGRWVKFTKTMENLIRRLKVERVKFQNTCESLLFDLCMSSELQDLLDDPGGSLWQQEYLQTNLRSQLGRSYDPYQDCVAEIRTALESIKNTLELDKHDKPKWTSYKTYKREWKRVRLSLTSPQIEESLDVIARNQRDLRELCGHRNHLESSTRTRALKQAGWYNSRNKMFSKIHDVLLASLTTPCHCELSHLVKVRLATPTTMPGSSTKAKEEPDTRDHFNVLVSFAEPTTSRAEIIKINWREIRIRYIDSPQDATKQVRYETVSAAQITKHSRGDGGHRSSLVAPAPLQDPARPQVIGDKKSVSFNLPAKPSTVNTADLSPTLRRVHQEESLCRAISHDVDSIKSLGKLEADENGEMTLDSFPVVESTKGLISLESLLSNGFQDAKARRLAMTLEVVSGLLQLHNTPWLGTSWTSSDIFVLATEYGKSETYCTYIYSPESLKPSTERSGPPETTSASSIERVVMRNRNIFFLGVILIELWFGKSLNTLGYSTSQDNGQEQSFMNTYRIANSVLDEVYQQAGVWYGDAVRRCVLCDFDQRNTSLSNTTMVEAVHQGVYIPLLQHFSAFCGQTVMV